MRLETYSYSEEEEDQKIYQMIRAWDDQMFPQGHLLPKLGVIVYDDLGTALCFLCADMSNSVPRAFIDHLQTNPAIPPLKRFKAVKYAEKFLRQRLKEMGYVKIDAVTPHAGLASISHSLGYLISPKPVIHLQKVI